MARPLRTVSVGQLAALRRALLFLREARYSLRVARARRSAAYVARSLKSAEGALRHARRSEVSHG